MSPLLIAVDLLQPSLPIESSLHLMPLPLVLIRHRSMDLADQTGLGPLRMTARAQETPSAVTLASVAVRMNATWNGSFLATLLPTEEGPVFGNRLLPDIWTFQASHLRLTRSGSLHRGHLRHHGNDSLQEGHPLQSECDSLLTHHTRSDSPHGGHLRLLKSDSPPRGHPHLSEWDSLLTQGLAHPGDPFLGILALQGHAPPGIPSFQREVPLLLNEDVTSREIQSLLSSITHLGLRLGSLLKRDPIHGLLLPILLLLRGKTKKLMRPLYQRRSRLGWTSSCEVFLKPRPPRPTPHLDRLIFRPR